MYITMLLNAWCKHNTSILRYFPFPSWWLLKKRINAKGLFHLPSSCWFLNGIKFKNNDGEFFFVYLMTRFRRFYAKKFEASRTQNFTSRKKRTSEKLSKLLTNHSLLYIIDGRNFISVTTILLSVPLILSLFETK